MHENTRLNLRRKESVSNNQSSARRTLHLRTNPTKKDTSTTRSSEQTKLSRSANKKKYLMSFALLLAALIVGGWFYIHSEDDTQQSTVESVQAENTNHTEVAGDMSETTDTFNNEELGISLEFNQLLKEEPLTDADVRDGFIARFTSTEPPIIVSIRKETGFQTVAALANMDTKTLLSTTVDKSLPSRYPEYSQITSTSATINGAGVLERVFTYTGPSGESAKQRLLIFIKDSDTAIYVSMQTTAALYDTIAIRYFDPLQGSISIN